LFARSLYFIHPKRFYTWASFPTFKYRIHPNGEWISDLAFCLNDPPDLFLFVINHFRLNEIDESAQDVELHGPMPDRVIAFLRLTLCTLVVYLIFN
jgi:hypothetical protein